MAEQKGTRPPQARRARPLKYFYLNKLLHKKLHVNRGADELTAWCYPTKSRVTYPYYTSKKRMEPAFTTKEAGQMLCRGRLALERAILSGDIPEPQAVYGMTEVAAKYKYMWHEDDILAAHAYFSTVHRGRPRNDGMITPQHLPNVRELRALIRNEEPLYVQTRDGEFIPTWRAPDI